MIVTDTVLQYFVDISGLDTRSLCDRLNRIGLEVKSSYRVSVPDRVVVAKVLSRYAHPNADRLSVCEVDCGSQVVEVVCGAKNVRPGLYVALALDGAIMFGSSSAIKRSDIRGVVSDGMICSSTELGLPRLNDGIMELDPSVGRLELGRELSTYDVFNQRVIDIDVTPNRGDCLSVIGIAREIASSYGLPIKGIDSIEDCLALGIGRFLRVSHDGGVDSSVLYRVAELKDIYTPIKVSVILGICGSFSSSHVENFLEFATHVSGVLFSAYPLDNRSVLDKDNGVKLLVKKGQDGFERVFLQDKVGHSELLSVVGVSRHSLDSRDFPRVFILEASHVSPGKVSSVMHTSDLEGIVVSDQVIYRSTRGSNPDLEFGMNFLCSTLLELNSAGLVDSGGSDRLDRVILYSGTQRVLLRNEPNAINTTFSYVSNCIGNEIHKEKSASILKRLGFTIKATHDDFSIIIPPDFRFDIENRQDIVEEVLRFYGIDNVDSKPRLISQVSMGNVVYSDYKVKKCFRLRALSNGYLECVHYLFCSSVLLDRMGFKHLSDDKRILNPLTSESDTLRPSLIPHMLNSVARNHNFGYRSIKIFEMGAVYDENRSQIDRFAMVVSGDMVTPSYPNSKPLSWDFYSFLRDINNVIGFFESSSPSSFGEIYDICHPNQSAVLSRDGVYLGIASKIHPRVSMEYGLEDAFFCELDLRKLIDFYNSDINANMTLFSRFQLSRRDLTVVINKGVKFSDISKATAGFYEDSIKSIYPLDVFCDPCLSDADSVCLTIRIEFQSIHKTLRGEDIDACLQALFEILRDKFGAVLRGGSL